MINQRDYISLKQAAEATFCSASFLLKMIFEKKLKGFKMGSRWYTTSDWLNDFNQTLKCEIDDVAGDLDQSEEYHQWRLVKPPLILSVQFAVNAILVFMLTVSLGAHVGVLENKSEMVVLTGDIITRTAENIRDNKISDELLTQRWQEMVSIGSGSVWGALGQVAGEFEEYEN
jgi:hypothetical protein